MLKSNTNYKVVKHSLLVILLSNIKMCNSKFDAVKIIQVFNTSGAGFLRGFRQMPSLSVA